MLAALRSEWVKISRPKFLWGTYGATAFVSAFAAVLVFATAGHRFGLTQKDSVANTVHALGAANGLVQGWGTAVEFLGILFFIVSISQTASEYARGTIRNVLAFQPHRWKFLIGKSLGLYAFIISAVFLSGLVTIAMSIGMGVVRGVHMQAWHTHAALIASFVAFGNTSLAMAGYCILGITLAILFRNSVIATAIGVIYLLIVENMLSAVIPQSSQWLIGLCLSAVAQGGAYGVTYSHGLWMAAALMPVLAVITIIVFQKKDIVA